MKQKKYTEWDAFMDAMKEDPKFRFTTIWMAGLTALSLLGVSLAGKAIYDESQEKNNGGVTTIEF